MLMIDRGALPVVIKVPGRWVIPNLQNPHMEWHCAHTRLLWPNGREEIIIDREDLDAPPGPFPNPK